MLAEMTVMSVAVGSVSAQQMPGHEGMPGMHPARPKKAATPTRFTMAG